MTTSFLAGGSQGCVGYVIVALEGVELIPDVAEERPDDAAVRRGASPAEASRSVEKRGFTGNDPLTAVALCGGVCWRRSVAW